MGPGGGERGRARRVRRAPRPPRAAGGRSGATPRCVWGARSRAREVGGRRGRVVGISGGKRRVLLRLLARPRPSSRRRPLRASVPPPPGRGRPATLPRRPVASPSGVRPLFPIARPSPPRPSRLAPRVRGWGGEGVCSASSPRPHPTPRAFRPWRRPRLPPPTKAADPRGADPPVASGGLCGVAGGGSPSRGRLPCPAASRRRPWAGLPRPVAGRPSVCRSGPAAPVARRLASPRLPSLGAFSRPVPHPPRLPRPSVRFSRPVLASPVPLTRVPCPLGAQLPVGAPSLRPRWWCGGRGRVPGNAGSGRGPPSGWAGARGRGPAGPAAPGV